MRKQVIAGNWKMNKSLEDGISLAMEIRDALDGTSLDKDIVLCSPFIHLSSLNDILSGTSITFGAQNCSQFDNGAYTGEISADMVRSTGANYVILGHSERRQYFNDTSEILLEKLQKSFENNLTPIFCIGEPLEIREEGSHFEYVAKQLIETLFNLSKEDFSKVIIAYEPIWAIGTGKTATPEQAQEMHGFIRNKIKENMGDELSENVRILYGGSMKPGNAKDLVKQEDVDGGLIGGASLKTTDFLDIINA
ncbi:MAG TPA: triose-phosphate isomerase [Cyclobacteriaceae bacterium]